MKKLFLVLSVIITITLAQKQQVIIDNANSYIKYTGSHFLHNWTGQSNLINGEILIDFEKPNMSEINIAVPILSFDSKNGNRDSNMLFVTEQDEYPNVLFTATEIMSVNQTNYQIKGLLNFHGIEKEIHVPVQVSINSDSMEFRATFKVNLIDFDVERPKLLLSKINEIIEVELYIKGKI
jgi:polyisoprenoid-binding protein YceI